MFELDLIHNRNQTDVGEREYRSYRKHRLAHRPRDMIVKTEEGAQELYYVNLLAIYRSVD